MGNNKNRLQFVHHDEVFSTRKEAINYVNGQLISVNRPALYAEPMVLKYGDPTNPSIILAIGSVGDGLTSSVNNKVFFIDIDNISESIYNIVNEIDIIKDNINVPESAIIDGKVCENIIINKNGLFSSVDVKFVDDKLLFTVNGKTNIYDLPKETFIEKGIYDKETESIILTLTNGNEVSINLNELIHEWDVDEVQKSPVVLTKTHIDFESDVHGEKWQDILSADIRIKEDGNNILKKAIISEKDGIYGLYVNGIAENIKCYVDGNEKTIQEAIDEFKPKISKNDNNIVRYREDGIYANVDLSYDSLTNVLLFKDGVNEQKEIKLNQASFLERTYYEDGNLVLVFKTTDNEINDIRIPISEIVKDFEIDNSDKTVKLNRNYKNGQYFLSADVNVSSHPNNILQVTNNELFVDGVASNIKYNANSTVEDELNKINSSEDVIGSIKYEVNKEQDKRIESYNEINTKIDSLSTVYESIGSADKSLEEAKFYSDSQDIVMLNAAKDYADSLSEKYDSVGSSKKAFDDAVVYSDSQDIIMLNAAKDYADTKAARFTAINTNSISTTLAANNTLKSDINLSNVNTNILTIDENGLSAKTELTFDPLTSILSFDNGIKKVDYHLTTNSLVSDVKYDQDGRLILVIQNVDGTTSEVAVQLDKLVGDNVGNSPIVISVSDSQNGIRKISASLSILSNDTNLIKQQNGSLYASKVASDHVGTYRDKQMTMQEVLGRIIEEIDGAENKIALKADKDSIPTKISDLINDNGFLSSIPSEYITEGELASRNFATYEQLSVKANKTDIPSLDGYAKESWVSAKIAEMAANGEIDLSGYATEDWVKDQRYLKQGDVDLSAYATKFELSGKADSSTVQQIRTDLNTLIGSDSDAVINKFNEIVSFLAGIEETETLEGLLNSIITEINKKADASSVPTKLSDLVTDETNTVNLSCGEY